MTRPFIPLVIMDTHELNSHVGTFLEKECKVIIQELPVADYIIADGVAAERKTPDDLIYSMIGREKGKLLRQVKDMMEFYEFGYLLIEGRLQDLFQHAGIHPNAVWGWLETCQTLGAMIRYTVNAEGTAYTLKALATKYQQPEPFGKFFNHHGFKRQLSHQERAERMIEYLPNIGGKKAHDLVEYFGSVESIINAPYKELMKVEGIGYDTAIGIRNAVTPEKIIPCFI